ncbi:hypothetical protein RclHR1_11890004 [Rhizophagus clarus]|uniref:Uncharacterized protein n=1 Tax=Rhizophagus clarus TaxID=94130 RepID=A0A2Z6QKP5_9GLOM|nr:hypothetical protein RclHR1_11890004 [Rhizophagus clarus]GES79008.1 hypothetical protein RCL_e22365_RclHR1_11890004 [Rhizophagus clarus]
MTYIKNFFKSTIKDTPIILVLLTILIDKEPYYIWTFQNIYTEAINAKITKLDIRTDHNLISTKFLRNCIMLFHIDLSKLITQPRIVYKYDNINNEDKGSDIY